MSLPPSEIVSKEFGTDPTQETHMRPVEGVAAGPQLNLFLQSPTPTLIESNQLCSTPEKKDITIAASVDNQVPSTPPLQTDFGILPIRQGLQWNRDEPPVFTLFLNIVFGVCSAAAVSNIYYVQPILIVISETFEVSYSRVTNLPTLLQASYCFGLLFVTPLGDLLPRRQLLLSLNILSSGLTLVLALVPNFVAFEIVSALIGAVSVSGQVLIPFAADLADPVRRALAISIVLSGLLCGLLLARVLSGLVAEAGTLSDVYWMALGFQGAAAIIIWATVPNYPAKVTDIMYLGILKSMVKFAVTEPLLIQGCFISLMASITFTCFWTTSTFVLGDHYGYNSLQIGLFGIVGLLGVCTAPVVGRVVDHLVPWLAIIIGLGIMLLSQLIWTTAAQASIGAVVVVIFTVDVGIQLQQVAISSRIFSINSQARSRLSSIYLVMNFVGQLIGTSLGSRVYLHAGYRASGGFCMAILGLAILILFLRGPHLPHSRWFGWKGGFELRKSILDRKRQADVKSPDV